MALLYSYTLALIFSLFTPLALLSCLKPQIHRAATFHGRTSQQSSEARCRPTKHPAFPNAMHNQSKL